MYQLLVALFIYILNKYKDFFKNFAVIFECDSRMARCI